MTFGVKIAVAFAALIAALATASAARADACEELATLLKSQIDGLSTGKPAANHIELAHPAVTRASLGCASRNVTNEVYVSTVSLKPSDDFYDFAARAAAVVFTIPSDDVRRGVQRCVNRIGILRGHDIATRYRRLDIRCSAGKDGTAVTISRESDT
ncbi:MAG: hypothetical protein ACLP1D_19900 [Xanthobacteraceae bacterium]